MEKPTIIVDVDDVALNLVPEWVRRHNSRQPASHLPLKVEDIKTWGFKHYVSGDPEAFIAILREEDLYDRIEPVPNAIGSLITLRNWGFHIKFVTAAGHPGKLRRLAGAGIMAEGDEYHIEADKWRIPGDILIDDRVDTCIEWGQRTGKTAILFEQPWNAEHPGWLVRPEGGWHNILSFIDGWLQAEKDLGDRFRDTDPVNDIEELEELWRQGDDIVTQEIGFILRNQAANEASLPWDELTPVDGPKADWLDDELTPAEETEFQEWARDYLNNRWSATDEVIVTNEHGGMQSHVSGRYDLIDPLATKVLAEVFAYGAEKYAPDNWRLIPELDHVNHALNHIFQYLAKSKDLPYDQGEDHLAHAMWRLHAAVAIRQGGGK